MSRHLPDKNRTESTHADASERDEDHAKVDTFSNHNHQRRRGHVQGRNRNQPHLLPLRRVSEGLYRKGRETQTHAHPRLGATVHLKIRLSSHKATPKRHEAQLTTFRQQKTTGKKIELSWKTNIYNPPSCRLWTRNERANGHDGHITMSSTKTIFISNHVMFCLKCSHKQKFFFWNKVLGLSSKFLSFNHSISNTISHY